MAGLMKDEKKKKKEDHLILFGSEKKPWASEDWTASDDRVRGGKSQSYLKCSDDSARFYGTLDTEALGGAGFASQRTTGDDRSWDLSDYVGIQLNIVKGDKKRYTFILKDELLPPNKESGREQSTISYECDFDLPPQAEPGDTADRSVFFPWKSFTPTYRGKVKKDADPLDTKSIKRISLMMRSFFDTQKGDFSLTVSSIEALKKVPGPSQELVASKDMWNVEKAAAEIQNTRSVRLHMDLWLFKVDFQISRRDVALLLGVASCVLLWAGATLL